MTPKRFGEWLDAAECRYAQDLVRKLGVSRTYAERWMKQYKNDEEVAISSKTVL